MEILNKALHSFSSLFYNSVRSYLTENKLKREGANTSNGPGMDREGSIEPLGKMAIFFNMKNDHICKNSSIVFAVSVCVFACNNFGTDFHLILNWAVLIQIFELFQYLVTIRQQEPITDLLHNDLRTRAYLECNSLNI
jgi:hypothetical protein